MSPLSFSFIESKTHDQLIIHSFRVSLELENYMHVLNYVQKGEQTPDIQQDPAIMDKLK